MSSYKIEISSLGPAYYRNYYTLSNAILQNIITELWAWSIDIWNLNWDDRKRRIEWKKSNSLQCTVIITCKSKCKAVLLFIILWLVILGLWKKKNFACVGASLRYQYEIIKNTVWLHISFIFTVKCCSRWTSNYERLIQMHLFKKKAMV